MEEEDKMVETQNKPASNQQESEQLGLKEQLEMLIALTRQSERLQKITSSLLAVKK